MFNKTRMPLEGEPVHPPQTLSLLTQKVNQTIRDLVNNVLVADINQTHQLPDPEGNYSDPQCLDSLMNGVS